MDSESMSKQQYNPADDHDYDALSRAVEAGESTPPIR